MRIVSEWTVNDLRITVFHMNGRYSIKLEKGLLEQVYKFRDGQFNSPQELRDHLDTAFYNNCQTIFKSMIDNKQASLKENQESLGFDEII